MSKHILERRKFLKLIGISSAGVGVASGDQVNLSGAVDVKKAIEPA